MANVFNLSPLFRENSNSEDQATMTATGAGAFADGEGYRAPATDSLVAELEMGHDESVLMTGGADAKKTSKWERESWSSNALIGNNQNDIPTSSALDCTTAEKPSSTMASLLDPISRGPKLFGQGIMRLFSSDDILKRSGLHSRSRSLDMLLDDRHYEELNFQEEATKVEPGCNLKPALKPEFVGFYTKLLQTLLHPLGKINTSIANPLQLAANLQKVFNVPNEIHVEMMQDELGNKPPACMLKVTVVEARDILGMDANGMSDPYCLLTVCKNEHHHSPSHEKHPLLTHWNSFPDDPVMSPTPTPAVPGFEKVSRRNSDGRRSFKKVGRKKSDDATANSSSHHLLQKQRSDSLAVPSKLHKRKNSADGSSIASPRASAVHHSQSLEAESVFKTTCQKATLHPVWNESFDISISSIRDTELTLTMWDMDEETSLWQACKSLESEHKMAGIKNLFRHIKHGINKNTDDFLGQVVISLVDLPAATRVDQWCTLHINSKGSGPSSGGKCHMRLQFVREEDYSKAGNSMLTYYHQLASNVYRYEGQKYITEAKGPWDGKLPDISRQMLNCFAVQQGISKLSQTLINLSSLLEFHHHQSSPAYDFLSFARLSMSSLGRDEADAASVNSLPESLDNIQRAGEEKGQKDINRKPGEEKGKENSDASLMDRALREAMFHIHAEMIAETTFSIYSNEAKDVTQIYTENPQFLSYELEVTESSIATYIDYCMSPVVDCPALFPPSNVQVLDILKSKCRMSNISSLLQMKVWKDRNSIPHQRVRKLLEEAIESDARQWLSNRLEELPQPGSLKPADLLNLLDRIGEGMGDMMALLRPTKEYQNFFMKFTVDYNKVVAGEMDHRISASLRDVLNQLNQYQVRYQKFAENIAESSKASLKLYMTVKKMYSVLKTNNHTCEGLEMTNYHTWFQEGLIFWLVTFKYETFDRVRRSLQMDKDVVLVHSVVKYSNSAVDAQSCFAKVTEEWHKIGFEGVDSRCMAITKITDLICEGAKLYAASIHKKLEENGFYRSNSGQFDIKDKLCITMNNIEHVRTYLDKLPVLLDWEEAVNSLASHHDNLTAGKLTYSTLQRMTTKASRDIINMSGLLERKIADKMCQEVLKVLGKVVNPRGEGGAKEEHLDEFFTYIDQNLETLYKQLMPQIFPRIVEEVWNALLRGIVSLMYIGKQPQYYYELRESLEALESYFQRPGLALDPSKIHGTQCSFLMGQLDLNSLNTHDLMLRYYKEMATDMATPGEYFGHLGIRMACKEETGGGKTIIVKVCNAVDLPGMDRSGTSDPFVVVEILPETAFDKPLVQQTRHIQHNLNPVFDETFQIPSVPLELIEAGGAISLTVMDHDVLWSNDFIGEAFIPLQQARPISMNQSVDQCPVIMMAVKRPQAVNCGPFDILKNRSKWDKNARTFYTRRLKALEDQKPRTDKSTSGPPLTNARLVPFFRQ